MGFPAEDCLNPPDTLYLRRPRNPPASTPENHPESEEGSFPTDNPTQVGSWKIFLENGDPFIRGCGFPSPCATFFEDLWVRIIDGNDFEGLGEVSSVPGVALDFRGPTRIRYGHGEDNLQPVYLEIVVS